MALGHAACLPSLSPLFYFPVSFPHLKPAVLPPPSKRHRSPRRLKSRSMCVYVFWRLVATIAFFPPAWS